MSLSYRNIGTLFGLNILNVLLSVAYSTIMIHFFGTSSKVEAAFAATVLGTTISRFVQTGQLVEILVPRYHKIKSEVSKKAAMSIISMMCNYMAGTAFFMVLCFIASGSLVIDLLVPGFSPAAKEQVFEIFCMTGFLMPIQIATNLFQGMLNAENIYGKVELTNTFSLLISVVVLLVFGHTESIYVLVVGTISGVLLQFATTVYYLREVGYRHDFKFKNPYFSLKEMWQALSATFFYMGGVQVQTFVFNAALSFLPSGIFAIYRYVETIYGKVANVFMIPISTVFFNDINRFIVQNNQKAVKNFVSKNLNFSYLVAFIILLPFVAGGQYFIWTMWGGSKFTAQDVHYVYWLLVVFFLTMVWQGPYMIYRKLAVSVTRPDLQYYLWGLAQLCSATIGYFLVITWKFEGLQIQIFMHTLLMSIVPATVILRFKKEFFALYNWKEVLKITLGVLVAMALFEITKPYFPLYSTLNKLQSLLVGSVQAAFVLTGFLLTCYLMKVEEIEILKHKVLGKYVDFKSAH